VSDDYPGRSCTPIAIIVVVVVVGFLACGLFSGICQVREAARRCSCLGTLKMFGIALHNYHDANQCFPPSMLERPAGHLLTAVGPVPGTDNTYGNGADFSWLVLILPYKEEDSWYTKLDVANAYPFDGHPSRKQVAAMATTQRFSDIVGPLCLCQSFRGSTWSEAPEYPRHGASVSNYVALGATHVASLYRTETQPIGGPKHPNGVIYPGSRTSLRDIADGSTNTFVVCETREQNYAAWIDGTTAAVVGLAEQTHPKFELRKGQTYWSPVQNVRTTINWGSDDPDDGKCYLPAADHSGSQPWVHGPSSFHPGLVNHLLGDGSVRSVSEDVDPAVYMLLITRAGSEPVNEFFD